MTDLTVRGVYFIKNHSGDWIKSHHGTPGVELTLGGHTVFIHHREVALLAKAITALGTSGENQLTIETRRAGSNTPP
jgi:hypothetical protein